MVVEKAINALYKAFSTDFTKLCSRSKEYKLDNVYYIEQGAVLVKYKTTIFAVLEAKEFIGLQTMTSDKSDPLELKFKLFKDTTVFSINPKQASLIVEQKRLYQEVSTLLTQRLFDVSYYFSKFSSRDAYKKIAAAIMYYFEKKHILINQISLSKFVIGMTGVSKSRVMFILAELKKGNYIEIENGYLVSINKLPTRF